MFTENYETPEMGKGNSTAFIRWFNKEIGTEYDATYTRDTASFVLFDLTDTELRKVKAKLTEMRHKQGIL